MLPYLRRTAAALLLLASFTAACSSPATAPARNEARPPAANADFDYQLGGPYPPPARVKAVSRDRTAKPAPGLYNICYVNAFQAQPDATHVHRELFLYGRNGAPVIDEDWREPLFDISAEAKRAALLKVVGPWLDGCADAGFDAVELDNLDSYERSQGLLSAEDAAAYARLLAGRAHARGLAVAQKNTAALLDERASVGFDFAVVEECGRYGECAAFDRAYGGRLFDIEYEPAGFAAACRGWGRTLSIVLRDRDVRPAGESGYVRRHC
ncbi:endo alpha-1,4 polygalactosaminidase [Spirillospora sp. NPDC029432]|uniref:endo alpha-1,4 polygalactosaminidase n=1 Tax=Spirillospora sp. NPDC029432 TaxID=3154599 RepID=UPI003454EAD0